MCYAEALATLVRESGAEDGILYRAGPDGELVRCAATSIEAPPDELHVAAMAAFSESDEDDDSATVAVTATEPDETATRWLPIAVGSQQRGRFERSGVAVLRFNRDPRALPVLVIEQVDRLLRSTAE
jgi:hypothetical protein